MAAKICSFRGAYGFLSNMTAAVFEWDGRIYRSSEAAYQSAKSLDPKERDRFCGLSGVIAKRAGRRLSLRSDWDAVKVDVMREIVRAKFSQNPDLLKKLLDTGDAELVEGNGWHDTFWGVDRTTGEGENHLGRILMEIREELGGENHLQKALEMREAREKAEQAGRAEAEAKLEQIREELAALPDCSFVGMEMDTKAFGRVFIKRHEGDYLVFDTPVGEKTFALPNCILQGFLIPDDRTIIETLKRRAALLQQQKEIQSR